MTVENDIGRAGLFSVFCAHDNGRIAANRRASGFVHGAFVGLRGAFTPPI